MEALWWHFALSLWRDRVVRGLILVWLMLFGALWAVGHLALVEQKAHAVALAAGTGRLLGHLVVCFACYDYFRRSYSSREMELWWSRPYARGTLVVGWILTSMTAALVVALIIAFPLAIVMPWSGLTGVSDLVQWTVFLGAELSLMAGIVTFATLSMPMGLYGIWLALGWYGLGRLGTALEGLSLPYRAWHGISGSVGWVASWLVSWVDAMIPDFDQWTSTAWLLYGVPVEWSSSKAIMEWLLAVGLLMGATWLDVTSRQERV